MRTKTRVFYMFGGRKDTVIFLQGIGGGGKGYMFQIPLWEARAACFEAGQWLVIRKTLK